MDKIQFLTSGVKSSLSSFTLNGSPSITAGVKSSSSFTFNGSPSITSSFIDNSFKTIKKGIKLIPDTFIKLDLTY